MRRLTRKKLKQDEFVAVVDQIIGWLTDNWRPVAIGLATVTAAALIVWGVTSWKGSREDAASWALHQAVKTYNAQQKKTPGAAPTAEVRAAFEKVVERYGQTREADAARLYLARFDFEAGKVDQAKKALEKVAARHKGDALGRVATLDLIHMQVSSGQASEVIPRLRAMATGQDDALPRDVALYELASAYQAEKDAAQAREYFQKLIDEFPKSPYTRTARQKLTELG
jgi:predicted negative regulator of RcsB-dependent stress response